jgi:hypothetical protein
VNKQEKNIRETRERRGEKTLICKRFRQNTVIVSGVTGNIDSEVKEDRWFSIFREKDASDKG